MQIDFIDLLQKYHAGDADAKFTLCVAVRLLEDFPSDKLESTFGIRLSEAVQKFDVSQSKVVDTRPVSGGVK